MSASLGLASSRHTGGGGYITAQVDGSEKVAGPCEHDGLFLALLEIDDAVAAFFRAADAVARPQHTVGMRTVERDAHHLAAQQAVFFTLQFDRRFWRRQGRPLAYGTDFPIGALWDGNEELDAGAVLALSQRSRTL